MRKSTEIAEDIEALREVWRQRDADAHELFHKTKKENKEEIDPEIRRLTKEHEKAVKQEKAAQQLDE